MKIPPWRWVCSNKGTGRHQDGKLKKVEGEHKGNMTIEEAQSLHQTYVESLKNNTSSI